MKRKTLIKRFEDALSKKECKKIILLGIPVDFYPSKDNPKEGLVVVWNLNGRMAKYFYGYYNTKDVVFPDGTILKGVDEYYPQIILFSLDPNSNSSMLDKYFNIYSIYIRNPNKSVNDYIYIMDEEYNIQKKEDLVKIDGLFKYIDLVLADKKEEK